MFGWLAKMLMQTPVASSGCACCEAKREKLEKIRQELTGENQEAEETRVLPQSFRSGSYYAELKSDGTGRSEIRTIAENPEDCVCDGNCDGDGGCCGKCRH